MRSIDHLDVSCAEFAQPTQEVRSGFFHYLERKKAIFLIITVALAFFLRVYQLDAAGLSEDETNKVFALRAYEQGDFTVNAEHPMMMKWLCFASTHAAAAWNAAAGDRLHLGLSEETAIRLPNAFFGALTVIPLLLFTAALLGFEAGVIAALLWSFGLNAVWFNRIGKEDTLLLFFMLVGFYFYHRGKQVMEEDEKSGEILFALAGAAFGLMLASKYFPHYLGLNALFYTLIGYHCHNNRPLTKRSWAVYFAAMTLAFAVSNPAVFSPQTWRYILAFLSKDLLTHHGYLVGDTLYSNDAEEGPGGSPWYFYWLYLAIKMPVPILVAFLFGVVEIFRGFHHEGQAQADPTESAKRRQGYLFLRFMLIFWLVPMTFFGAKFLRYALTLMPLVYMTAAVGTLAIGRLLLRRLRSTKVDRRVAAYAVGGAVAILFLVAPAASTIRWGMPYPSLYVNVFGQNHAGYFFPHDEFYDLGARESLRYIAEHAPPNATIATDIPGVVQYYLERFKRPDVRSRILSHPTFDLQKEPLDYVLLQRGRVYFENQGTVQYVESRFPIVQASRYAGATASTVYQIRP